jgi:hypothetical protein
MSDAFCCDVCGNLQRHVPGVRSITLTFAAYGQQDGSTTTIEVCSTVCAVVGLAARLRNAAGVSTAEEVESIHNRINSWLQEHQR